jgi:two-component system OmpR family sensor kinase
MNLPRLSADPPPSVSSEAKSLPKEAGSVASGSSTLVEGDPSDELRRHIAELAAENAQLAEAVAARDAFLAIAAHELRNPMTPIMGRVSMLRRMIGNGRIHPEKIEQSLDQIEWLITMFVKRATTLLDVSRITSDNLRLAKIEVNVRELIQAVADYFQPLAQHACSELKLDLPMADLSIMGDRLALEQVLDNLVSNAIKYTGGTPIVMRAAADTGKGTVRICVSDGGPGISPENQARIFERFERAVNPGDHTGGFGVGLWIVKRLCEAMDGSIDVTSTPGAGSTFCVTFPLAPTGNSQ